MATNPATVDDLTASSLRALSTQELSVGTRKLASAWGIIVTRIPSIVGRLDAIPLDTLLKALVIDVQCDMVLRFLNNPDGLLEESGDDYKYRRDSATSRGVVYLTDEEEDLLEANDGKSEDAFSIKATSAIPHYSGVRYSDEPYVAGEAYLQGDRW